MSLISNPTSSSANASFKICIVICSNINYSYEVFVVDVGLSSDINVEEREPRAFATPLFQVPLDFPSFMTFFAFESSIYFFGGDPRTNNYNDYSKDVFVCDTSSDEPGIIKQTGSMNSSKGYSPLVIGPVNEKFYVLHGFLEDFEEFSPKSDAWKILSLPTNGWESSQIAEMSYAVVNNDSEILMSSPSGLFSYNIGEDVWNFAANKSLPFEHGALSIGKDLYFVYAADMRFWGFCTCRYNANANERSFYRYNTDDRSWDEFPVDERHLHRGVQPYFCMSSDDHGLVCAVKSDCLSLGHDDDHAAKRHSIHILRFGAVDGPDLHRINTHLYKEEEYDANESCRLVTASFPFRGDTEDIVG